MKDEMGPPPAGTVALPAIGDMPVGARPDYPTPDEVVQVCCVLTGDWPGSNAQIRLKCPDLGVHYVQRLYEMVSRFAPPNIQWRFTCFTDRLTIDGVTTRPIPPRLWSYFAKLYLFSADAFPLNSRVLFFDLDTCIVKNWNPLATVPLTKPVFLRDLWDQPTPASGVMSWRTTSDTARIWEDFKGMSERRPPYRHPIPLTRGPKQLLPDHQVRTDEQWLYHYLLPDRWAAWQDLCPGDFASFKYDVQRSMRRDDTRNMPMTAEDAKKLRVIYFHGQPRPHQVKAPWNPFWRGIVDE